MKQKQIQNVPSYTFATDVIGRPFPTTDQAQTWLGIMAGTQGTRSSMAGADPQDRLNLYCDALQAHDQELWYTSAEDLTELLNEWLAEDEWAAETTGEETAE